jgi:hypothetical protein
MERDKIHVIHSVPERRHASLVNGPMDFNAPVIVILRDRESDDDVADPAGLNEAELSFHL